MTTFCGICGEEITTGQSRVWIIPDEFSEELPYHAHRTCRDEKMPDTTPREGIER